MAHDTHGGWYTDGFMGGSELASDCALDEMIYPERYNYSEPQREPIGPKETFEEYRMRCRREEEAEERARFQRDRDFQITQGDVVNSNPGGPRKIPRDQIGARRFVG